MQQCSSPNRTSLSRPSQGLDLCVLELTFWWGPVIVVMSDKQTFRPGCLSHLFVFFSVTVSFPWRFTGCVPAQTVLGQSHAHLQRCWHAAQSIQILWRQHLRLWLQRSSWRHLCKTLMMVWRLFQMLFFTRSLLNVSQHDQLRKYFFVFLLCLFVALWLVSKFTLDWPLKGAVQILISAAQSAVHVDMSLLLLVLCHIYQPLFLFTAT